jgi:hypothetical protein
MKPQHAAANWTRTNTQQHRQQQQLLLTHTLQVYEATREAANWAELLQPRQTLGVHCLHFYNNSNVTNSQLVQRRVRDAVCDAVRDARWVVDRVTGPEAVQRPPLSPGGGGKRETKHSTVFGWCRTAGWITRPVSAAADVPVGLGACPRHTKMPCQACCKLTGGHAPLLHQQHGDAVLLHPDGSQHCWDSSNTLSCSLHLLLGLPVGGRALPRLKVHPTFPWPSRC